MRLAAREEPFFGTTGADSASSMYRRTSGPPSAPASRPLGRSTLSRCSSGRRSLRQPSAMPSDRTGRLNLALIE